MMRAQSVAPFLPTTRHMARLADPCFVEGSHFPQGYVTTGFHISNVGQFDLCAAKTAYNVQHDVQPGLDKIELEIQISFAGPSLSTMLQIAFSHGDNCATLALRPFPELRRLDQLVE
jgi:hypothetical protein